MKFYMSYWSCGDTIVNKGLNIVKFLKQKSIYYIKKNYKEIHLITDELGKENFKDLGWTSISTELEALPKKYNSVWSAGKIFAINKLSKVGDPFIHIDYDLFLTKPLKKEFIEAEVLVEYMYNARQWHDCPDYFINNCKNLHLQKICKTELNYYLSNKHFSEVSFNCGIIGGNNLDFFKKYSEQSLKMLQDSDNEKFWMTSWEDHAHIFETNKYGHKSYFNNSTKSLNLEQLYLALCLKILNITPKILVRDSLKHVNVKADQNIGQVYTNKSLFDETGYLHFMGRNAKAFVIKYLYDFPDKEILNKNFEADMKNLKVDIDENIISRMMWIKDVL